MTYLRNCDGGKMALLKKGTRLLCLMALLTGSAQATIGIPSQGKDNYPKPAQTAPVTEKSLWNRVRTGFELDLSYENRRIEQERNWYVRNPSYFQRVFHRASPFLHHIVEETEKRGIPLEFALLPVVESAFDPFAYSHGRAAGLWQFIPGTAKRFGLRKTWWYDGRRDIVASTDAALQYLTILNRMFDGDWLLALAAYNAGEGNVLKAIRRNKARGLSTSFWALNLPKETQAYVPRLLALSKIVSDPARYGIELPEIPNRSQIALVELDSQIDLGQAARLAGIEVNTIYQYNPGFNHWATDPEGPHQLLVPAHTEQRFLQAYAELPASERIAWQRHTVRSGDSLIKLAKQYRTTPDIIRDANRLSGSMIRQGQSLMIPTASMAWDDYTHSQDNRLARKQASQPSRKHSEKTVHRVRRGDTLWDLSRQYGVSTQQLAKWNGMAPGDMLRPGKKLVIWQKPSVTSLAAANPENGRGVIRKVHYKVRSGDSLSRIANRFRVEVAQLVRWNGINRNAILRPGKRLEIYVDVTAAR